MSESFDESLMKIFAVEAAENLDGFEDALINLERDGLDAGTVQEAFRLIHNIKGSAAMVGLGLISELAHTMEDRLDLIRKGTQALEPYLCKLLFQGIDQLRAMLNAPEENDSLAVHQQVEEYIRQLKGESDRKETVEKPEAASREEKTETLDPNTPIHWERQDLRHIHVEINHDVVFKDVKAYLIKTNLQGLGTVLRSVPPVDNEDLPDNNIYDFLIATTAEDEMVREKVESAAELKTVIVQAVTLSNREAIQKIFGEQPASEGATGIKAAKRTPTQTFGVIVHRVNEMTSVIKLIGEMDGDGVVTLMDLFQENPSLIGNIILDFSKLQYINSLGLGLLIRLYKNVQEREGRIAILTPPPNVRRLLENTKINSLIPVFDTVEEAYAGKGKG